jgi:hypothetical protein
LHRSRDEVFRYHSVQLTETAFQACSFNHSDISPFRINDLRAAWNRIAQKPLHGYPIRRVLPFQSFADMRNANEDRNCVRPSNSSRSLTAICLSRRREWGEPCVCCRTVVGVHVF